MSVRTRLGRISEPAERDGRPALTALPVGAEIDGFLSPAGCRPGEAGSW